MLTKRKPGRSLALFVVAAAFTVLSCGAAFAQPSPFAEYGDAPDGQRAGYGPPNTAVTGNFPTQFFTTNSRYGLPGGTCMDSTQEWLGALATRESGARDAADPDTVENLIDDDFDDGLVGWPCAPGPQPVPWPAIVPATLALRVTAAAGAPPVPRYLNILIDLNHDGVWAAPGEWVVVDMPVLVPSGSSTVISTPPLPLPVELDPAWMRVALTRSPVVGSFPDNGSGWDGSGMFAYGEIEDYLLSSGLAYAAAAASASAHAATYAASVSAESSSASSISAELAGVNLAVHVSAAAAAASSASSSSSIAASADAQASAYAAAAASSCSTASSYAAAIASSCASCPCASVCASAAAGAGAATSACADAQASANTAASASATAAASASADASAASSASGTASAQASAFAVAAASASAYASSIASAQASAAAAASAASVAEASALTAACQGNPVAAAQAAAVAAAQSSAAASAFTSAHTSTLALTSTYASARASASTTAGARAQADAYASSAASAASAATAYATSASQSASSASNTAAGVAYASAEATAVCNGDCCTAGCTLGCYYCYSLGIEKMHGMQTFLYWNDYPGEALYDVVAGYLQSGDKVGPNQPSGGLGPATCLSNNSPYPYVMDPGMVVAPGQALYYMQRSMDGPNNDIWGSGTTGQPRVPLPG